MISFIVPATKKTQIDNLEASLKQLGQPFELIPIYKATSMFDAWRKGVAKSKGEYICLTHQDTEYIAIPDLDKYFKNGVGMVGVAGTTVLHKDQPWWFSKERLLGQILSGQIFHKGEKGNELSVFGPFGEVVILDGVCLITRKDILLKVGIPEIHYAEWDFYDHVISLEYKEKGYNLLTVPIIMVHASKGGGQASFDENMVKFKNIYLLDKTWRI